ncbi:hypothetical protein H3S84_10735 [Bartonella sp. W8098]|nr:hypothetical protein [Bartonella apis]MBI0172762.1 hypothetical protein [Bartonella sp. W8151]
MIDVGGADLNFATKKADGTFDLSKGVLQSVFGTGFAASAPTNPGAQEENSAPATPAADDPAGLKALDATLVSAQAKYAQAQSDLTAAKAAAAANPSDTSLQDAVTTAQGNVTSTKSAVDNALKPIVEAAGKMTVMDFVNTNFSGISSSTMEQVLKAVQSKVTTATSNVVTAGATLGAAKAQVTGQIDYVSKLMDAVDKGVGSLVDADMNAESARLASLQVQQQLGIQALSIANQNSQNILSLFRQ